VHQVLDTHRILLEATLVGLEQSVNQHMPAGLQRDFYLWALSPDNPYQNEFLQTTGVLQLVNLTARLLDGLVDGHDWKRLAECSVPINIYQTFEIISDNLAIGLVRLGRDQQTLQRHLLYRFNNFMTERLKGDRTPASQLLGPMQSDAAEISSFAQSLNHAMRLKCAQAYLEQHSDLSLDHLEYALWPLLVANVETCVALADTLDAYQTGSMVREGLVNRYQAVNRSLEARNMSLMELANIGAHSILVVPSLGYSVAVLAEMIRPNPRYHRVLEDGTLTEALYSAALLIRLLNDLGGGVLHQSDAQRHMMVNALLRTYQRNAQTLNTISLVLLSYLDGDNLLTRIHKDLFHGEFNIALYNLKNIQSVPDAIHVFGNNLAYFTRLYSEHYLRLEQSLDAITHRLNDKTVSTLIRRFVEFHAKLYSNHYTTVTGEYAI
jgi:hypothetical protein